jgi:hypothetical protein
VKNLTTKQGIFNAVYRHLIKQGARSATGLRGLCMYRGPFRRKCAIGALIKDEHYTKYLEGVSLLVDLVANGDLLTALVKPGVKYARRQVDFLADLQRVHDSVAPEHWKRDLAFVAETYRLKVPRVSK